MIKEGLQTEGHWGTKVPAQTRGQMVYPCYHSEEELFCEGVQEGPYSTKEELASPHGLCGPMKREVTPDSQGGLGTRKSRRETFCSHCKQDLKKHLCTVQG